MSFANETVPSLRDGLRDESNSAQGYVDMLRITVVNRGRASQAPVDVHSLSRGLVCS